MFSDISGYTYLMGEDEEKALLKEANPPSMPPAHLFNDMGEQQMQMPVQRQMQMPVQSLFDDDDVCLI